MVSRWHSTTNFRRQIRACVLLVLFASTGVLLVVSDASAQAYWQPQPAPAITADYETWFRLGEPITFEGYVYYPAGARVFFDGNVMVRSGAFRGIPLYVDTTIEAYSRIFVPVAGGQLQPYARRRTGDAAGTPGSRAPSFPVTMAGEVSSEAEATGTGGTFPTASPLPENATSARAAEPGRRSAQRPQNVIEAGLRPKGLDEIYVTYQGSRWRASGKAVRVAETAFQRIGQLGAFPVYTERGSAENPRFIYVPSRSGWLARYERAGPRPSY